MNIFKRPMLYAVVVCSLTAALWLYSINPILVFLLSAALFIFLIFKFNKYKYITVLLAVLLFGTSLYTETDKIKEVNLLDGKEVSGEFVVTSEPVIYEKYNQIILKTEKSDDIPQNVKLLVYSDNTREYKAGDKFYAFLKISAIDNDSDNRFYNYGYGIYATASIEYYRDLNQKDVFYSFFGNVRSYVKNTISNNFDVDSAGLMLAITTGDKSLLSDSFLMKVKETGISHVIVVSGMHLSIIISAAFLLFDRMFYNKYLKAILSVAFVLLISGICGNTISVMRAGAMFLIGAFAPIFNRDKDMLSSLLTAVVLLLIMSPFAIVNVSFLLSVLATLAIIWVLPFYSNVLVAKFHINSKIIITLIEMILASVFALIFTLPVIISTFGYTSVVAPITNLSVTYFVTFGLIFSCLGLILSPIPIVGYVGKILMTASDFCCKTVVFLVNKISSLPITIAIMPRWFVWIAIGFVLIIIALMYHYQYEFKKKGK